MPGRGDGGESSLDCQTSKGIGNCPMFGAGEKSSLACLLAILQESVLHL